MTKVFIGGDLPDGLETEFLQYIRDFDISHAGCHFAVLFDQEDQKVAIEDMEASFRRIVPGFAFSEVFKKP